MNENISQLAEEATYIMIFDKEDSLLETTNGEITYQIPAAFILEFTKLIVEKCATLVNDAHNDGQYPESMIKEYFGFE